MNATAAKNHLRNYHRAWDLLTPPLKPHPQVVDAVRTEVGHLSGRTLLLGVTPELATVADTLIAVDRNFSMVRHIWPGNSRTRCALVGDWRNSNFAAETFAACIGDGSLSFLRYPDEINIVLREVQRILSGGGRLVCRLYIGPAAPESCATIKAEALSGRIRNFHSCKLRLGMALASHSHDAGVGVSMIRDEFNTLFPDRAELACRTNWDRAQIDTIDHYEGSDVRYSFPSETHVCALASVIFGNARVVGVGNYEMAELCPMLIAEKG